MSSIELKQGVLNRGETLFQGIAASAPAGAAVATMTGAAGYALGALPLSALIAFFVVVLNAYIIKRISSRMAGAGGYYDYTKVAFGPVVGAFTGWMYILYQIFAMAFIALSISVFVPALLSEVFGINIPAYTWLPLLAGTMLFGYFVSVVGIKQSLKYAMVMGTMEILVVIAIGLAIVLEHPAINTVQVFTPKFASGGISGVMLGVLFMYTSFSGFGTMTPLGEEAKNGKKMVGNTIVISALILGVFFVFAAYSFTVGWGPLNMSSYASNLVPGIILTKSDLGLIGAIIITVFYINSILTDIAVFFNSSSRVSMALARNNILPNAMSRIHHKHQTPHVSAAVMGIGAFLIAAVGTVALGGGGFNIFLVTGIVSTLPALLVHAIANAALPALNKKETRKWGALNVLLPIIAIVILGFVFYGTFISISSTVIIGSVIFLIWVVVGIVLSFARKKSYVLDKKYEGLVGGQE
ncbi:MAG: APC family permease [Thermoplasmataceae archaeon]|jgi:amino acid transporter